MARAIAITQITIASPDFYPIKIHKGIKTMIRKSPIKKTAQFSLNSVPVRELVETLDEQNEESLSGGAKILVYTGHRREPK